MRIAMFLSSFPLVSETFILRQITGLLDLGHQVDIYAETRPPGDQPQHPQVATYGLLARTTYLDLPAEAGYWEQPAWPPGGETWIPGAATPLANWRRLVRAAPILARAFPRAPRLVGQALDPAVYGAQARSLSALYRLARLCGHAGRYDVVHAQFGPVGNSFRFARALWRAPLVVSFHGYDFSAWPRQAGRDAYVRLFATADAVTVNSRHTWDRLADLGCPPERLHLLPVGVDLDATPFQERGRAPDGEVRALTVARLVEKKGIAYAIRAVAQARAAYPELVYHIAGDGPLRAELETLARDLGVAEQVIFHGAADSETVRHLLSGAHLFILPSVTAANGDQEGQGLALLEAQAAGLPVLATDHNGFSESVVPGQSGFLVPERDVAALAERLSYLLGRPEDWPALGRRGRRHVAAHFDIRALNRQLVALYQETAARYRQESRRA